MDNWGGSDFAIPFLIATIPSGFIVSSSLVLFDDVQLPRGGALLPLQPPSMVYAADTQVHDCWGEVPNNCRTAKAADEWIGTALADWSTINWSTPQFHLVTRILVLPYPNFFTAAAVSRLRHSQWHTHYLLNLSAAKDRSARSDQNILRTTLCSRLSTQPLRRLDKKNKILRETNLKNSLLRQQIWNTCICSVALRKALQFAINFNCAKKSFRTYQKDGNGSFGGNLISSL